VNSATSRFWGGTFPIIVLSGLFFAWSLRDMAARARDQKSDAT
jgi:hypothetical protein